MDAYNRDLIAFDDQAYRDTPEYQELRAGWTQAEQDQEQRDSQRERVRYLDQAVKKYTLSRPTTSQQKVAPGLMAPNYHSGTSISPDVPLPATDPQKSDGNSISVGVRHPSSRGKGQGNSTGEAGAGLKRKSGSEK